MSKDKMNDPFLKGNELIEKAIDRLYEEKNGQNLTGVIHPRNYYFLTTFHGTDLTHFAAFSLDLAMMKMSRGHYEQNSECRSVLETRQIAAKGGIL